MSWSIGLIKNTVVVPKEFEEELLKCSSEYDELFYEEALDQNGKLIFDPDHMEHMDYLWREDILDVLFKAKVNGTIAFASVEGDDSGEWWAHDFVDGVSTSRGGKIADLI